MSVAVLSLSKTHVVVFDTGKWIAAYNLVISGVSCPTVRCIISSDWAQCLNKDWAYEHNATVSVSNWHNKYLTIHFIKVIKYFLYLQLFGLVETHFSLVPLCGLTSAFFRRGGSVSELGKDHFHHKNFETIK